MSAMISPAMAAPIHVVAPVDQFAHDRAVAGDQHQRHEGERDAEREHNLGGNQRRVGAYAERDHERREHPGDQAAGEQRHLQAEDPAMITCSA
nr:hypothetical protein [Amycolatopsis sulphurea]